MKLDTVEVIETQNAIISLQASVINELYKQLMQYATVEELEASDIIAKINAAAMLRRDID